MTENEEIKHDFDLSWLTPLNIEQIHYLFFYMITQNKYFAPKPSIAQSRDSHPNVVHNWEDLTFYLNTKCPDSPRYTTDIYRTAWRNFLNLHTEAPDTQWRLKYSRLTQTFPDTWLSFMNYGYYDFESNNSRLGLEDVDEEWRYAIQLYDRLLGPVQIEGKDVLEIGCGRGGGASYITRYMKPGSYIGTDGTMSNIMFCKEAHDVPSLEFEWSKAESLSFPDNSFDIVLNLESCNYYDPFTQFVDEVFRVLKPGGYLLLSTWDVPVRMLYFRTQCGLRGFEVIEEEDITFNVAMALEAFEGGKHVFANHQTIRSNHTYLETWRSIYNVEDILSGRRTRYCRFALRKP